MGQFKPMVKMMTTEPSVVLKLKKGGAVAGHKPMKKMDGGTLDALATSRTSQRMPPAVTSGASPARPALAARRRALMGRRGMAAPMMAKKGGEMESKAMHAKEATKAELKAHADKPASKAHKGLKTGGVVMGQGGYKKGGAVKKYAHGGVIKSTKGETIMHEAKADHSPAKTGGVKMGNAGGYKKGGRIACKADGGAMRYVEGNVVGTPAGKTNTTTGGVRKGNAGGYKKGGAAKKFARGGLIDDGRPEKMPQGHKKPTPPVSISQLSGSFKKGGKVSKMQAGGAPVTQSASSERKKVEISAPTPEELKRLRETYDRPARMENQGAERFQRDFRLRKKGGRVC